MSDPLQSLKVVGDGPGGATILEVDRLGARDGSGRYMSGADKVDYPLVAVPTANYIWMCLEGVWQVTSVQVIARVSGGTGATIDVLVCQQAEAVASGVTQLTAVLDVEETAPFKAVGTLIASPTPIFQGDSVAFNGGGTLTGLIGILTVGLKRIQ